MTLESGDEIHIEQRKGEEVTEMWYEKRMAPEGVGVVNPAFDVTDHSLVTGIITEKGIAYEHLRNPLRKWESNQWRSLQIKNKIRDL